MNPFRRKNPTMDRYLIAGLLALVLFVSAAFAGNDPEVDPVASCHGQKSEADCHGVKTEAGGASSCHGRRQTRLQRAASRQTARQDARDVKRAARASCHGQAKASDCDSECECN